MGCLGRRIAIQEMPGFTIDVRLLWWLGHAGRDTRLSQISPHVLACANPVSCGEVVIVGEAAEPVAPLDRDGGLVHGTEPRLGSFGRYEVQGAACGRTTPGWRRSQTDRPAESQSPLSAVAPALIGAAFGSSVFALNEEGYVAIARIVKTRITPDEYEQMRERLGVGDAAPPPGGHFHVAASRRRREDPHRRSLGLARRGRGLGGEGRHCPQ